MNPKNSASVVTEVRPVQVRRLSPPIAGLVRKRSLNDDDDCDSAALKTCPDNPGSSLSTQGARRREISCVTQRFQHAVVVGNALSSGTQGGHLVSTTRGPDEHPFWLRRRSVGCCRCVT